MSDARIFEPEGRAIPYVDEGHGPAVLLLPDHGLDVAYLSTLAEMLTEADHRIVRIGSRRPDAAPPALSMHDLAQDLIDVMDHLQLDDAWVGGHGFGGSIARTAALDHTDRVNGVLLLGVEVAAQPDSADGQTADARHSEAAGLEQLQQAARAATPDAEWTTPATHVPVLVIQGTEDRVTPPVNGENLREAAPDRVSVVSVDGGGHLFPGTHPGATAWAIEDYLDWD